MTRQSVVALLLPRPVDFLVKGILSFILGVGVALAEGHLAHQPGALRADGFRGVLGIHTPIHEMSPALLLLAWFFIQSFLVEQAKYTWNDIRDHQRDQTIPLNRHRPLAKRKIGWSTYVVLALRWGSGLVLAFMLDGGLFAIVLYLSLLQVLYEYWAKPAAGRYPTLILFLAAGAGMLRFFGGAMAVGAEVHFVRLWLYGLSIFALGAVGVAAIWRGEASYFVEKGLSLPKPHSRYFGKSGMAWMWAGASVVVASVMILIADAFDPLALSSVQTWTSSWRPYLISATLLGVGTAAVSVAFMLYKGMARLLPGGSFELPCGLRPKAVGIAALAASCAVLVGVIGYYGLSGRLGLPFVPASDDPAPPDWTSVAIPASYLALLVVIYGMHLSRSYASIARVEPVDPAPEPLGHMPRYERVPERLPEPAPEQVPERESEQVSKNMSSAE